jgi:hypothetical protein
MSLCWIWKSLHTGVRKYFFPYGQFEKEARAGTLPDFSIVEPSYLNHSNSSNLIVNICGSLIGAKSKSKDNTILFGVFSGKPLVIENRKVSAFLLSPHVKCGNINKIIEPHSITKSIWEFNNLPTHRFTEKVKEAENLLLEVNWMKVNYLYFVPPETSVETNVSAPENYLYSVSDPLLQLAKKLLGCDSVVVAQDGKTEKTLTEQIQEKINSNIAFISHNDDE